MKTKTISVSQWIAVPPNPIQRNTERHAARAKHLLKPLPVHAVVSAAELPDGSLMKLDGHTRAFLWRTNQVRHPPEVHVNVYPVNTIEEAKQLYSTFDAKEALETVPDKVAGAFGDLKFVPTSGLLVGGSIASAVKLCWGISHGYSGASNVTRYPGDSGWSIYNGVNEFSTEIFALDSFGLKAGSCPGGIVAAFLLTYRKHGADVLPFWRAVFANAGERREGKMDGVQALNELLLVRRGRSGQGSGYIHDLCARAVNAAERWLVDDLLVSIPRPYNLEGYIDRARPAVTLIKQKKTGT